MTRDELLEALMLERYATTTPEFHPPVRDLQALIDAIAPLEAVDHTGDVA